MHRIFSSRLIRFWNAIKRQCLFKILCIIYIYLCLFKSVYKMFEQILLLLLLLLREYLHIVVAGRPFYMTCMTIIDKMIKIWKRVYARMIIIIIYVRRKRQIYYYYYITIRRYYLVPINIYFPFFSADVVKTNVRYHFAFRHTKLHTSKIMTIIIDSQLHRQRVKK